MSTAVRPNDRRSMPQYVAEQLARGRHVSGVLILGPEISLGQIIEELLSIWGASDREEYRGIIIYLPLI